MSEILVSMCLRTQNTMYIQCKWLKQGLSDEHVKFMVVLIGLVVIFRDQLTGIVNSVFGRIAEDANAL